MVVGECAQQTLLSAGADGAVLRWNVDTVAEKSGAVKMFPLCGSDKAQEQGPHRFVIRRPGPNEPPPCIRGLDVDPTNPECFVAGTDQCDVWEVDKDPEVRSKGAAPVIESADSNERAMLR